MEDIHQQFYRTLGPAVGRLLVRGGYISQVQLRLALDQQKADGRPLGEILIELGFISEKQLSDVLQEQQVMRELGVRLPMKER